MIKKGLKVLGVLLMFFTVVIIANELLSQYLETAIDKIRGGSLSIFLTGLLFYSLWEIIDIFDKYIFKRILKNQKRNDNYKNTELLMKSYLEEHKETQGAKSTYFGEIEKRQEIIKNLYDRSSNLDKGRYDNYRGCYNEIERHFCENEIEDWELELWNLRVIICEMKKRDYRYAREVLNKLKKVCNKIIHKSNMEEWMKISYIACLDGLSELIKEEEMQRYIKLALNKLNKERIDRNMLRKYSKYIPDKIKPCKPDNELEYYIWYLPYMIQKQNELKIVVIYRYIRFLDNSYKILTREILENKTDYSNKIIKDYLAVLELYDKIEMSSKEGELNKHTAEFLNAVMEGMDFLLELIKRKFRIG